MNDDYVAQRRAYVKEIRDSFGNSNRTNGLSVRGESIDEEEAIGALVMFKVKFLLCIFLFAAFVICDRTGIDFFRMSTDTVYEKVTENYDYTNLQKYVMMVSDFDKNK